MSLHKLTTGSGYDYLTRQVDALDATSVGETRLQQLDGPFLTESWYTSAFDQVGLRQRR